MAWIVACRQGRCPSTVQRNLKKELKIWTAIKIPENSNLSEEILFQIDMFKDVTFKILFKNYLFWQIR